MSLSSESKKIEEELKRVEGFIDVEKKEKEILDERLGKIVQADQTLNDIAASIEVVDREKGYGISDIEIPKEEEEEDIEEEPEQEVEEEVFETDKVIEGEEEEDKEEEEGGQ
jgi:hypothetical protein